MSIRVELFEPSGDVDKSLQDLAQTFAPLYGKAWVKDKQEHYEGKAFDPNIAALARMWLDKVYKIFIAYDGQEAVGYLTGTVFRPLPYQASVFQIDDWFGPESDLIDYMKTAIRFIGCDEIWVTDLPDRVPNLGDSRWKTGGTFTMKRWVKA